MNFITEITLLLLNIWYSASQLKYIHTLQIHNNTYTLRELHIGPN